MLKAGNFARFGVVFTTGSALLLGAAVAQSQGIPATTPAAVTCGSNMMQGGGPGMMGSGNMMGPGMMGPGMNGGPMMGPQGAWPNSPGMGMGMMRLSVNPTSVPAGQVSLRVANNGWLPHEVIVMPLGPGQSPGQRPIGGNWEVDEAGSLGEAAQTCGAGQGDGIAPGTMGWTTLTLNPGRYELLCNIAGHYGSGMYTELDVTPAR